MACFTFRALFRMGADLNTTSIWKWSMFKDIVVYQNDVCRQKTLMRVLIPPHSVEVLKLYSPLFWSVSTWSACLKSLADWYKKTSSSNRTGCCRLPPIKYNTYRTRKGHNDTWKAALLADLCSGGIDETSLTHQALRCELRHLMDHTVGKVQHTYTAVKTHRDSITHKKLF